MNGEFSSAYLRAQLKKRENRLQDITFTHGDSSFLELKTDFLIDFQNKIRQVNKNGGFLLEIGGGVEQKAAAEILALYPQINYFALEKRKVANLLLLNNLNFTWVNCGISEMSSIFKTRQFDLIMAHYVAEHLVNPFYLVEVSYRLLNKNGHLYINRLPILESVWEKVVKELIARGIIFKFKKEASESRLVKAGIIFISVMFEKQKNNLRLPIAIDRKNLTAYDGSPLLFCNTIFNSNRK